MDDRELDPPVLIRDAFIGLREGKNRRRIINLIKTGGLPFYFKLIGYDDECLLCVPKEYWEFMGSDNFNFNDGKKRKFAISIYRMWQWIAPALVALEEALIRSDASTLAKDPIFQFWFQKFKRQDSDEYEWERLRQEFTLLRNALINNAMKKLNIFTLESFIINCKISSTELNKEKPGPKKEYFQTNSGST